jgi:hypothetical protein
MTERFKIVSVRWIDITESANGWRTLDELEDFITDTKSKICNQVGLLYEEDEHQLVLVSSYFPEDDLYGVVNVIPKGCIIEMKEYGKF